MCDFYSWIEKGKELYFLDDATIEARWPNDDIREHIGHAAIEEIFPEAKGWTHKESAIDIPPVIAKEINRGHMDKMARAGRWAGARYDSRGHLSSKWWRDAKQFIEAIKQVKWFDNHGKEKKGWKIFDTRDQALAQARDQAWDQARDQAWDQAWYQAQYQARDKAWDQAWYQAQYQARDQAWDQARDQAWDQAWYQAWYQAQYQARDKAWDQARNQALDQGWDQARSDFALYVSCLIADPGLPYSKHATDRLDVWMRGYGLLCDIGGVLYVYRRP